MSGGRRASTFTLTTADGVDLFVYCWLPGPQPRAAVQIAHGLAEHAGRYARLAEALTAAGYAVYASDHRGHGRTARSADDLGFFAERDGWQKCVADLWQVNRHIAAAHRNSGSLASEGPAAADWASEDTASEDTASENPAAAYRGLPIFLLGHSMGSTLAEQFMGDHGETLAGVVLCGANGKPTPLAAVGRTITRAERLRLGARGRSKLAQSLTFEAFNKKFAPARTAFDWLSRDPAEVDKYVADPLCGFPATVQLWIDLLDGWREVSSVAHRNRVPKKLPLYVIAGGRDPVNGNTRQLEPWLADYQAAGHKDVTHRFYSEARHELFNETNREEVTRDLIAWLDRQPTHP
jgi:alpha-beta hydrolase superfamily lysophospholipase